MELSKAKRYFLIGLPFLLIPSTALVFVFSARMLSNDWGYLIGFLFYWAIWCYLVPFIFLGKQGIVNLFKKEPSSLFRKNNWYLIILLLGTIIGAVVMYFIPRFGDAPLLVMLFAIPIAIIGGAGEEILWRGLYIKSFPGHLFWAYFYPTIWFAVQHISSQLIEWGESTPLFIALTVPLGLVYGLVAYRTGSIRWNSLAHILISFFGLGEPISTSIYQLLFNS
jgi:membrane protease YdiL (CAAX protease family)